MNNKNIWEASFNWKRSLLAGVTSSLAVAATASAFAGRERRDPWRAINAISHIVWGQEAGEQRRFSWRYSGMGLVLNLVACGFWAALYERLHRATPWGKKRAGATWTAMVVSVAAYLTDYHLVPSRLTPGFELSLPRKRFPWLYGALAAGLCLPDLLRREGGRT